MEQIPVVEQIRTSKQLNNQPSAAIFTRKTAALFFCHEQREATSHDETERKPARK